MPIYEFTCKKCKTDFEDLVPISEYETCPNTECPNCHSKKWEKLISCSGFAFSNPIGTDKWNNSHDYRFKHNIPKVKQERETAEKLSHMGANPYKDTSEKDFKLDTGIHSPGERPGLS